MIKEIHAENVAEWFLNKNNYISNITDTEGITNMKLQKLLYYSQGCYLKKFNKILFPEKIFAWQHGPVVKEVYNKYKEKGAQCIEFNGNPNLKFDSEIENFLDDIYDRYGQYSAWKLREMTHSETPWKNTTINEEIGVNFLREFFKSNWRRNNCIWNR